MPALPRRKPTRKAVALTEEQKELERLERELRQRAEAVQQRLQKLPLAIKKRREESRRLQRVDTTTVAYGEIHQRRSLYGATAVSTRRLRKDRNEGKMKFLVLCLILLLILVWLWRMLPTG